MEIIASATSTSFGTDLAAAVASTVANVWTLAFIAIGLPLGFWVIHQVMGLFPKTRASRR